MNATDFIQSLGGTKAVADLLGVGQSAVSNWKKEGSIPSCWYLPLARAAVTSGVKIDPVLFRDPTRPTP